MRMGIFFVVALVVLGFSSSGRAQSTGERALYLSGNQTLMGCIYRPKGEGPFPAVVFSQHNATVPDQSGPIDPFPQLARLFVSKGFIFFVPGRYPALNVDGTKRDKGEEAEIKKNEDLAQNLLSSVTWLKAQHDVDDKKVGVIGEVAGGIPALLAAQKGMDVRGLILFSPGVRGMQESYDLQKRLKEAVQVAAPPIFLIQSENDMNLLPKTVFGPVLAQKGSFNEVKVYPSFGEHSKDALRFAVEGSAVWQRDVLAFLNLAMN